MTPFQRNVLFYLIATGSAVLSITSIVVVMELNGAESAPASVSAEKLETSISGLYEATERRHVAPLPRTDTAALRAATTEAAVPSTAPRAQRLLRLYRDQQAVVLQWEARTSAVLGDVEQMADAATDTYEVDAGRPGIPLRERRFLELSDWYRDQTRTANAYLDSGRVALAEANIALASLRDPRPQAEFDQQADSVRAKLNAAHQLLVHQPSFDTLPGRKTVRQAQDTAAVKGWAGTVRTAWNARPRPITALSSWLRDERSLELASLIGMLGFGLLGAATSTVVRRKRDDAVTTHDPITDNLSNLLLSGVSAALATYLAVKGGLAVVSSESALPNSYLLLLTCFVAAVYWEEAWVRVKALVSKEPAQDQEAARKAADEAAAQKAAREAAALKAAQQEAGQEDAQDGELKPAPAGEQGERVGGLEGISVVGELERVPVGDPDEEGDAAPPNPPPAVG
jgi:hypothetical protein